MTFPMVLRSSRSNRRHVRQALFGLVPRSNALSGQSHLGVTPFSGSTLE